MTDKDKPETPEEDNIILPLFTEEDLHIPYGGLEPTEGEKLDFQELDLSIGENELPLDETGEVDITRLFQEEQLGSEEQERPGAIIENPYSIDRKINYIINKPSKRKLDPSKLEVFANLPELPKELVNRLEVPYENRVIVYEGRVYDLEKKFAQRNIDHLSVIGRVSLKRTDYRKEKKEQKPDFTSFTPQYQEVETPEEIWHVDFLDKSPLFLGFKNKYSGRLSADALNSGVWVYDELVQQVFSPIDSQIIEWMKKVSERVSELGGNHFGMGGMPIW